MFLFNLLEFYRVTLEISELYRDEYADIQSSPYIEFTKKLNNAIVQLLFKHFPSYEHLSNVIKIS